MQVDAAAHALETHIWAVVVLVPAIHVVAQFPQCANDVVGSVSHPSELGVFLFPLQSRKPELHVTLQLLVVHVAVALLVEQTLPQPPQLLALLVAFTSQPFRVRLSQLAQLVLHEPMPQALLRLALSRRMRRSARFVRRVRSRRKVQSRR